MIKATPQVCALQKARPLALGGEGWGGGCEVWRLGKIVRYESFETKQINMRIF
jgi:hypothetical protein